jgi:hypothetical protein
MAGVCRRPGRAWPLRFRFNRAVFNEVGLGIRTPDEQPGILRHSQETQWTLFRFGPTPGEAFADDQFPVESFEEFGKQAVPEPPLPRGPNPTWNALAHLANNLGGAVLMGHSQSAFFPQRAALIDASNIKAIVPLETITAPASFCEAEASTLASIPTLIVYGDHLADVAEFGDAWASSLARCERVAAVINEKGGDVTVLHLPKAGIFGNSHMLMQDRNNLEVADLILRWIRSRVGGSVR